MTTNYNIYVVNKGAQGKLFWCFLTRPQALVNDPGVYANSSASLYVDPNYGGTNQFTIPVQYVVGAGASNNAVGLNVKVISNFNQNTDLGDAWEATYYDAPPNRGPTISANGGAPAQQIAISTNGFNESGNNNAHWYANQTFGIQTANGFIGMSWSPSPQETRTITPLLSFYIATGNYDANSLASWNQVSNNSAQVNAPADFDLGGNCTVTLNSDGSFTKHAGAPAQLAMAENLAWFRTPEHHELMALAYLSAGSVQKDELVSSHFGRAADLEAEAAVNFLTGTITVKYALTAAFATFVLAGVMFTCKGVVGSVNVDFSYSGPLSVAAVKDLFQAGAELYFGKKG